MPLPTNANAPWPPRAEQAIQRDITEADCWYVGDTTRLAEFYTKAAERQPSILDRIRFWTRQGDERQRRKRIHVPVAADIASAAADLLFGEAPAFTIPEAHTETADSEAKATEDRLQELVNEDGIEAELLEAAEVCSALGGVYLRPTWDANLVRRPILTTIHADRAIPEFRFGILIAVTFWRDLTTDQTGVVWRHLERHEPGRIEHGLYVGRADTLGTRVDLERHPDTKALVGPAGANQDGIVTLPTGLMGLDVRYVPNVRPNRKHRASRVGRSDTQGVEGLMDALDLTMTSWIRDIDLAKHRIIVPDEFLDRRGRGEGAHFDMDQEVFSPLTMDPSSQEKAGITLTQFQIRTAEHESTCRSLIEQIARSAGYSMSSLGMDADDGEITATEVRAREGQSLRTSQRKARYWRPAGEDVLFNMLVIDREIFGSGVVPMRPRMTIADGLPDDPRSTAETLELLSRAQAASVQTLVRMAQPHLEGEELDAEVARVLQERAVLVGDPTGGLA